MCPPQRGLLRFFVASVEVLNIITLHTTRRVRGLVSLFDSEL